MPLQGSLGTVFGVCANQWSPDDGVVVSVDHGCGAHSETDAEAPPTDWPAPDPLIDELSLELVQLTQPVAEAQPEAPAADEVATDEPASDEVATDEVATDEVPTRSRRTRSPPTRSRRPRSRRTRPVRPTPPTSSPDEVRRTTPVPTRSSIPESTDAPDDTTTSDSADESPARPDPEP